MTTIASAGADSAARQDLLARYARLAIRVGINLEPGREVAIRAMIEHAPLVRALVRAGYEAGARRVEVDYEDLEVLRSQIALATRLSGRLPAGCSSGCTTLGSSVGRRCS